MPERASTSGRLREYVIENAADLADAFGVTEPAFVAGIARELDDARLARRLLAEAKRAGRENRGVRTAQRIRSAQGAADALGRLAEWEGDRATVEILSLLASALTTRSDVLVFEAGTFRISIPMARLFELRRLGRSDLWAFVDPTGLHIRWPSGGLNFLSVKPEPKASTVTVHLRARAVSAA